MIRFYFSLLFVCSSLISLAQDSTLVSVTIVSKTKNETVQNVRATITMGSTSFFRNSNMDGKIEFKAPLGTNIDFKLAHSFYASASYEKRVPKNAPDTLNFIFEMSFLKTKELRDIYIYPPGVPDTIFVSKRLHVADFELMNDGNILLLAYPKRLKKGSELIIYDGRKALINFQVPKLAQELIHDFRGNPHVVCEDMVYAIQRSGQSVGIAQIPKNYYMTYVAPVVDTNATKMYFSNFNPDYPAFDYFVFDGLDSTYKKIMEVQDDLMMELYRSEYKWVDVRTKLWAKNLEIQTGVDAEIYVGANYFTQSIYYKEVYAPMFHRNDSLLLFDYYKDKLYTFNKEGDVIDSVEIYHHYNPKSTGWDKQLIQDESTGKIYAVYDRAGYKYLGYIDTKTGEVKEQVKLKYRYVDKIGIRDNFVYYIYREFESIDKRMLWRERLPYNFGEAEVTPEDNIEAKK
ncbi:MAG: hypothetical protein DCO96_07585 [Fluviicola sp. XM-24bin1]|nr:MAG: hypothetical protein DCO96_07585 [Fluviicola sp. XM-24bin1]